MLENRYSRNCNALSPAESASLKGVRVFVAGCGGLGGFIIEELGRLGVGSITAIDGDVFEESNLNRQLLSAERLLGTSKAAAAKARMEAVNSEITVTPVHAYLTGENCREMVAGHHLVMDALDNVAARLLLEEACALEGIPLVHGAIGGWCGQVSVVMPGDGTLGKIYRAGENATGGAGPGSGSCALSGNGEPAGGHCATAGDNCITAGDHCATAQESPLTGLGNPSFTPGVVASLQVAEAVKLLTGRESTLRRRLLIIDLLSQEYETIEV